MRTLGSHPDPVILEGGDRFSGGEEGMGETFTSQGMAVTIWALSLGRSSRRARRPTRRGRNHYISIWGESLGITRVWSWEGEWRLLEVLLSTVVD